MTRLPWTPNSIFIMDRRPSTSITAALAQSRLFSLQRDDLSMAQRIDISYLRAQAIALTYKLTAHDITSLSPKFWAMYMDNIAAVDIAPMALLVIQYNLAAGTIAPWAEKRPELQPIMQQILDFEVSGQFMLTEQAHGLDAFSLETRADMQDDGSFILNTPHDGAAKFMPPTVPLLDISLAKYAVVFARLFVKGEDHGVRPFVVQLSTTKALKPGVRTRMLPGRVGAGPLGHSITWFDHIKLAPWACLGPLSKPNNFKVAFRAAIWRIGVGGLVLGAMGIPCVGVSAFILARYSMRRHVINAGKVIPIIDFRTQQIPILHALAQSFVMQAFMRTSTLKMYTDFTVDTRVRAGIAAAAKVMMMIHIQESCTQLSDRAGAQGLYGHNQIISMQLEMRGASISEGDTLADTHCLRQDGQIASPRDMKLAFSKSAWTSSRRWGGQHRSDAFNRLILPRCKGLVEAIGQRFFYEAAKEADLEQAVLEVYEAGIVKHSPGWFAIHAGIDASAQAAREDAAITTAMPHLERWLQWTGAQDYAIAPIMTQAYWDKFVESLPLYNGTTTRAKM
ncbi:Acyl-CoA dehydrogenase NM domain-like protein [Mycena sanguinolenta]|uniref:Acyl-CoA dehydrogenase NM domain-like protein n=1 Tax=Mycena sanguinolenta TaxID=230812 RepID=A0A8H6YEE3_9AGAR|nr:Acyl-CoA dehydrogenase NM domain-like protein [Mycena sanguinolenta]